LHGAHVWEESKKRPKGIVIAIVIVIFIVLIPVSIVLYDDNSGYYACCSGPPLALGMVPSIPANTTCGTTAGALYYESVSISSTSGSITTNTLGLKVVPTQGGSVVANVPPPTRGSLCPTTGGFYIALVSPTGVEVACWTGGSVWTSPTAGVCAIPIGNVLGSPITLSRGQTLTVYMYGTGLVPPMEGAYALQAFGTDGHSVSGEADL